MPATADSPSIDAAIWGRVVQFDKPPSPSAARALLKLQFPDRDRQRIHELAAKAQTASLSREERAEAEAYERLGSLLDILHSRARRVLKHRRTAS